MRDRLWLVATGLPMLLGLSGCPVTDDYFIDAARSAPSAGGSVAEGKGGSSALLQGSGGSVSASAGDTPVGDAGAATVLPGCMPGMERCNGHDDNCNDLIDEQACNSLDNGTGDCVGFVIAGRPDHGYMLCPKGAKDYADAQLTCKQQSMRLAWLETADENADVAAKVKALMSDEVWLGATDVEVEGEWLWDGDHGYQFWAGSETGASVDGAFDAWMSGTPNDDNGGEDCAVLNATTELWGDRSCSTRYAYLCEEPK
jgi:hypothetical protein